MRLIIITVIFIMLCGCAGVAAVLGCGAESFGRIAVGTKYSYNIYMEVETLQGKYSKNELIECEVSGNFCGGGSWYPEWKATPAKLEFEFPISEYSSLRIEGATCTMLKQEAPEHGASKEYIYGFAYMGMSEAAKQLNIWDLKKTGSLEKNGAVIKSYSVQKAPNK